MGWRLLSCPVPRVVSLRGGFPTLGSVGAVIPPLRNALENKQQCWTGAAFSPRLGHFRAESHSSANLM